jgi:trk system potassium uptake protein TrkH
VVNVQGRKRLPVDGPAEALLDRQRRRYVPIPLRLVAALAMLVALGATLLLLPGMTTQPITFMDALFTSTSAAAVTGLTVLPTSTVFTRAGQWVILLLMQFGGLGFVVVAVLTLRLLGRHISLLDRLAVSNSLGLAGPGAIIRILLRTLGIMLVLEGTGAAVLWLNWHKTGAVPPGDAAFYALFHAVAAFCNAGFDLFSGLPQYPHGIPADAVTLLTLGVLVFSGGLGIPVYMELMQRFVSPRRGGRRRSFSLHTRLAFWTAVVLILLGWAGLLISEYRLGGVLTGLPLGDRILRAWFQSVSARTAGFASLSDFAMINEGSRLLLMCLMFVGSAPASMGGGITTGTLAVLTMAMWSFARGYDTVRAGRRTIPVAAVWRALVVLIISLGVVMVTTWLLLLNQNLGFSATLFEVISAFSTTGLSLGITGELDTIGRLIIIALMFWGRLGAVTIMLVLLNRGPRASLVKYPEEPVLVG